MLTQISEQKTHNFDTALLYDTSIQLHTSGAYEINYVLHHDTCTLYTDTENRYCMQYMSDVPTKLQ